MRIENIIELSSCFVSLLLLFFFVPKNKLREASLGILAMQSLTWVVSGLTVEFHLISYPVRFFSYAFRTNFSFEFIIFPIISTLFNLFYPKHKTTLIKTLYSLSFPTLIVIGEVVIEKYTDNIKYINWNWFYSWSSIFITLLLAYRFYHWFFKKYNLQQS